jgi:hypothetical protein
VRNRSFVNAVGQRLNETSRTAYSARALYAQKMVKTALQTRTRHSMNTYGAERRPLSAGPDPSLLPEEADAKASRSSIEFFDIGSFDMVRKFVEHVVDKNALTSPEACERPRLAIDWDVVEASVADAPTLEQAIGRAVVIAEQMSRDPFASKQLQNGPISRPDPSFQTVEDPFFAFSMADVVPDFGDASRYRLRVARKVARIFGSSDR